MPHNITAGGDQTVEPVASVMREEYELPGHHLEYENSVIQDMCRGNRLFKVQELEVSQDEVKKLDAGKMVAVSAPVTNMGSHTLGGCSSSVVIILLLFSTVTISVPGGHDQSDGHTLLVHLQLS